VINYRTTDLAEWGRSADGSNKVDLVIDCVGGKPLADTWWCVKNGGTIISIVRPPDQFKPADCDAADVRNFFFVMSPNGPQLQKITALIEEGKCRPVLDSTYALKDFERAFERVETGHARGKAVIDFDQQD
jgi:NADPH:quinone reductase-like Zn-dependent oxidoreductase